MRQADNIDVTAKEYSFDRQGVSERGGSMVVKGVLHDAWLHKETRSIALPEEVGKASM